MSLNMLLVVPQEEREGADMLKSRLNEIRDSLGIEYMVVYLGPEDIRPDTSSFQERIDLGKETDKRLTNQQLKDIGIKNKMRLPESKSGYLYTFVMIYKENEPLIYYPQHRKRLLYSLTIDKFFDVLLAEKKWVVIPKISKKAIRVLESELELYGIAVQVVYPI